MHLRVHLSDTAHDELLRRLLRLLLDPLIVRLCQLGEALQSVHILLLLVCVCIHFQTVRPAALVQVQKHLLLTLILAIVDCDGVVMLVEATHESHSTRVVQMADVGGSLSWLHSTHHDSLLDAAESVDDNFAFY